MPGIVKEKEVSLFRNGRSQAVRIPKEFEFDAESVLISKDDDGVLHLRPKVKRKTLVEVLDELKTTGTDRRFSRRSGRRGAVATR